MSATTIQSIDTASVADLSAGKLQPTKDVLVARVEAAIKKHMDAIKQEVVKGAKDKGYNIKASNVKSVTFKQLKNVKYDIFSIDFGKFVITNPKDEIFLQGMTWTNNTKGSANEYLVVSKSTEDTYQWQISAGFSYEYQTTEKLTILSPIGGSIENSFKFNFNFQASYGQASSETHAWENRFEQSIPPYSRIRMEVKGVQFTGYVPFTITAEASASVECECEVQYWGSHTQTFSFDLSRLLSKSDRTFVSTGKVDGVQGYDWDVKSFDPEELTMEQRAQLPPGVTEQNLLPDTLELDLAV